MAVRSELTVVPRHRNSVARWAVWTAIASGGLVFLGALPSCGTRGVRGPHHLIVISMDTARADHFGFLGNRSVRTPHLDALAQESIVFEDCMTAAPSTLASHTSLITGKYPHHHGTPRNGFMVNLDNDMLPEILKRNGFQTAGFAASFALDSRFDFAQGFDFYDETYDVLAGQDGADQNQRSAGSVTDAAIRYLNEGALPARLFLFVHYFDPHQPYAAPAPFDTLYDPAGRTGLPTMRELKLSPNLSSKERQDFAHRFALQYASEISYLDEQLGRLLDDLRARGILDDALLVITSDHGENLADHPAQFDHGYSVYQSTMRAVCLIRLPRAERGGTRRKQIFSLIDVLPTVLRYLGIAAAGNIDGEAVNLKARESSTEHRIRYGQATKPWTEVETDERWTNMRKSRCLRQGGLKFIQSPWLGTEELYDLTVDPEETTNLLEDPSPRTQALATGLRSKLEKWAASAKPLPSRFESAQREETIKRLRSLGYIN